MSKLEELIEAAPTLAVMDSFVITNNKVNNVLYDHIMCAISGGSDSDIMLDQVHKLDEEKKTTYVFFDTGLEYQATKDHLKFLEEKYGISIVVERAVKPIPMACRQYGVPFLNKRVSEYINRLQRNGFQWEDEDFETLCKKYPKCTAALRWWCNAWPKSKNGHESQFNISNNKWLKEFMVANPPTFKISKKCCDWAKKKVAKNFKQNNNMDLNMYGVRKAEGGQRSTAYKTCFTCDVDGVDEFRPIFWYKNEDKKAYEDAFGVTHSKCYTEYGLTRTGCAGCPFGRDFEQELEVIEKYEPKLFGAVNKIFGDSYAYTRKYREFVKNMKEEEANLRLYEEWMA